jgi:AbrB family looped-hinge helix DNA binding protein
MSKSIAIKTRTRLDSQGRLVIPAAIRKQLDLRADEPLTLQIEDGELRIRSVRAGIRRAQELAAKYVKGRTGLVDEFIAERRREAERE